MTSLDRAGPLEQTLVLARELRAAGVEVRTVCASERVARRFEEVGSESTVIPLRGRIDVPAARRIWRFARGADVVHAQDRASGLWTRIGPRRPRRQALVYTVHGVPDPYLPRPVGPARPGPRGVLAYRVIDANLSRRADALVVPSRDTAETLVRRLGFPADRVVVIPNGVVLPPAGRPPRGSLVGTLSELVPRKGLDVFLRAAALLANGRETRYGIFGEGPERDRLEGLAGELRIRDRVEMPGHIGTTEALSRLSVFVLSSWWENCPMALLEAMAAGVPAVATSVGGVPEMALDGSIKLVEPGDSDALADAVASLLEDAGLRRRQAEAARSVVERRFSARANAAATLTLYERLIRERSA